MYIYNLVHGGVARVGHTAIVGARLLEHGVHYLEIVVPLLPTDIDA